jgi:methylenetetrahydrofolate dehydrogenase (NADP+)/methenyltetrahydrofolate cyclohydrolase
MTIILDGKKASEELSKGLKEKLSNLSLLPRLAIINVGNNPSSLLYIKRKVDFGRKIGIETSLFNFPEDIPESWLKKTIQVLNSDKNFGGIIVQLPLPSNFSERTIIDFILPHKDVDGLTQLNQSALFNGEKAFVPATARGIGELLAFYGISVQGKKCAVIGYSDLAGKPTAWLLEKSGGIVEIFDENKPFSGKSLLEKDLIVSAVGKPNIIVSNFVKRGAIVIDVGINFVDDLQGVKLVGDVDFKNVKSVAGAITPVPGGVGPMTVLALFENLIDAIFIK